MSGKIVRYPRSDVVGGVDDELHKALVAERDNFSRDALIEAVCFQFLPQV